MVRNNFYAKRFAFTMIELIFAIVIIAITVVSLPMMTQVTSKGVESNLLQEAVFAGSAELMDATAGYWDERSIEDTESHLSRVIDIGGLCENNDSNPRHRLKLGHIAQPFHRRCVDSTSTTGLDGNASSSIYSLNDAAGSKPIFVGSDGTGLDSYKDIYTSSIVVSPSAGTNNVKVITITVSNSDGNITVLKTQSANIGEIDYYKRTF